MSRLDLEYYNIPTYYLYYCSEKLKNIIERNEVSGKDEGQRKEMSRIETTTTLYDIVVKVPYLAIA